MIINPDFRTKMKVKFKSFDGNEHERAWHLISWLARESPDLPVSDVWLELIDLMEGENGQSNKT